MDEEDLAAASVTGEISFGRTDVAMGAGGAIQECAGYTNGRATKETHYRLDVNSCWLRRMSASEAEKALADGQTEILVRTRAEAEELVYRNFALRGYKNTTGLDGKGARELFGNRDGTYHWDDAIDPSTGRSLGHGADNPHGALPHANIYHDGGKITIYFEVAP